MSKKNGKAQIDLQVGPRSGGASTQSLVECIFGELSFRDQFNVNKAEHRQKFTKEIARRFGIPIEDLDILDEQLVQKADAADELAATAAEAAANAAQEETTSQTNAEQISQDILAKTAPEIIEAAKAFLANPRMMDELASDLKDLGIVGEESLAKAIYLICTSRNLPEPAGGVVQAASAAGKSFVTNAVVNLLPKEDVIKATDLTPNALYYMPQGSLKNKVIVLAERKHTDDERDPANANATLAIREMLSTGSLVKMVPVKGDDGLSTQIIEQEGPIAYLETTTIECIFDEDATRLMSLVVDESANQTSAIIKHLARRAAGKTASCEKQDAIRLKHQTAQRLLQPLRVKIPFAEQLRIPSNKLVARRAFTQLLTMIGAVAILRQFQKKIKGDYIVASERDYVIAYRLMAPILGRVLAPLSHGARELFEIIRDKLLSLRINNFERADVVKWCSLGLTSVRQRLDCLCEAGMIEQLTGGKGIKFTYKITKRQTDKVLLSGLVSPETLKINLKKQVHA
jgi:hypothetical protein